MTARRTLRICGGAFLLLGAFGLVAQQTGRDPYRNAYRTWREAEPDLERDASAPNDKLAGRASRAAAAAASFGAARAAFLRQLAEDQSQNVLWLQNSTPGVLADFAPAKDLQRLVSAETANVNTTITTFSGDQDRGIQLLRQALEREREALAALDAGIADRQKAQDRVAQASDAVELVRPKALTEYQDVTGMLLAPSAAVVDQETAAWAKYYPSLTAAGPASGAAPAVSGAAPAVSGAARTPAVSAPSTPRSGSLPPLPLTRYTGVWVYPTANGRFFGAEPEFVDFTVHEENGHVTGAFYARFKLPSGGTGDPVLRFDLSGDFQPTPRQSFALQTGDGAKGTIELIPGNAFNLLEINFQTDPTPGKVRSADLVLVKK